jgi:hypothetical protein
MNGKGEGLAKRKAEGGKKIKRTILSFLYL